MDRPCNSQFHVLCHRRCGRLCFACFVCIRFEAARRGRGRAVFLAFAVGSAWRFGFFAFALASAFCLRASCVAPLRGGTYFSLPPQRKVGKRKRLTPPVLVFV